MLDFIKNLLVGEKVEWKSLGEVCELKRGKTITKKTIKEGNIPVLAGGQKPAYFHNEANRFGETVVIAGSGAYAGFVSFWDIPVFLSDSFSVIPKNSEKISTKYVYYFLKNLQKKIYETKKGGGVPHVYPSSIENFQTPIPPLHVQKEIVKILDKFTQLEAELEAELVLRTKQYNYYREKLLTPKEGWEMKSLGEIGTFTYGFVAKAEEKGDTRFVRISDISENGKLIPTEQKFINLTSESEKFLLQKNDILMARTGATYGKTMIFEEDYKAVFAGFLIKISFPENLILPKFYWHFAQSALFWEQAQRLVTTGGQPQFNANSLKIIHFSFPPLSKQQKIVEILDSFDILVNSISDGLPKEIELRKKQYEYYREKLLTFE